MTATQKCASLIAIILQWKPVLLFAPCSTSRFVAHLGRIHPRSRSASSKESSDDASSILVSTLLEQLDDEPRDKTKVTEYIKKLEHIKATDLDFVDDNNINGTTRSDGQLDPVLVGLYDVAYVQPANEGENPVGGKWTRKSGWAQKLLRTRRTWQHILPVNDTGIGAQSIVTVHGERRRVVGEAINVIALEALGCGRIRLTILLRGDAVLLNATERVTNTCRPLSTRAVRAVFDAPRVTVGKTGRWINVNVGPKSSVVLDTTYVDEKIRIGLGGRSGSRFVFKRCPDNDAEAQEFRILLARKPWDKFKTLVSLAGVAGTGLFGAVVIQGWRVAGISLAMTASFAAALLGLSDGGIEAGDRSVAEAKDIIDEGESSSKIASRS